MVKFHRFQSARVEHNLSTRLVVRGVEVTFQGCVREISIYNLGEFTDRNEWELREFPQFLHANSGTHGIFPNPSLLTIHNHIPIWLDEQAKRRR